MHSARPRREGPPPRSVIAMREFTGTRPTDYLVGEIVGLRTFRVDESGLLLPLYSEPAWYDGTNTAVCAPPTGDRRACPHPVPSDDCECGFYAYGTTAAAIQNRHSRYVRAVVSCWGGVVAGTQGVRAQHARIDAIWLHPEAPGWLRVRVAGRYPSARMYADGDAMLTEHPLSRLDCYDAPRRRQPVATALAILGVLMVLALGVVPYSTLSTTHVLWELWVTATASAAALTAWLVLGAHGVGHWAAAFVLAGLLGWLLAPLFGLSGWLLRVPMLRGVAVAAGGYLVALRPHYFPVVKERRAKAFCGVRP